MTKFFSALLNFNIFKLQSADVWVLFFIFSVYECVHMSFQCPLQASTCCFSVCCFHQLLRNVNQKHNISVLGCGGIFINLLCCPFRLLIVYNKQNKYKRSYLLTAMHFERFILLRDDKKKPNHLCFSIHHTHTLRVYLAVVFAPFKCSHFIYFNNYFAMLVGQSTENNWMLCQIIDD